MTVEAICALLIWLSSSDPSLHVCYLQALPAAFSTLPRIIEQLPTFAIYALFFRQSLVRTLTLY